MFERDKISVRGHEVFYEKGVWKFKDTGKPIDSIRPCKVCCIKPGDESVNDCPECKTTFKKEGRSYGK